MPVPPLGSVVTLECLGSQPGLRFLDGRTVDGTVGLALDSDPTGTQWALTMRAHGVVSLKCLGDLDGNRFLDGETATGTVGLAATTMAPFTGTRWAISEIEDGIVTLQTLGHAEDTSGRLLDGRTAEGSVGLAPRTDPPFTGTRWRIRQTGKLVMLFCLGHVDGARFLDGRTLDATVGLARTTDDPFTGTIWHLKGSDRIVTLKSLGSGDGRRFLDGRTAEGTVGLAPHAAPPFTGTRWQLIDFGSGEHALKCLGASEGLRFLDGRTLDGTVALVGSLDPEHRGTRWRILTPQRSLATKRPDAGTEVLGSVRVAQLAGTNDPEHKPLLNRTHDWGVPGLDLGANAEHSDRRLYIFFGDVVKRDREDGPEHDEDLVAWIDASSIGGHVAAGINFVLPFEETPLQGEHLWRYCRNCHGLFFDGTADKGVCPSGGGHQAAGERFVLPFESTLAQGQRDWRRCSKCNTLFFERYADHGVCPAGGVHAGDGARLVLPHNDLTPPRQADWRFCLWCRTLFFDGYADKGVCPAGGTAFRLHPVMKGDYFDPIRVAGPIGRLLTNETPTGAFSYDNRVYVFVWMGRERDQTHPAGSYLLSKLDPHHSGLYGEEFLFSPLRFDSKAFWQVAPWPVRNVDHPGLPSSTGDGLVLLGHGWDNNLNSDAIHLGWMPLRSRREAVWFGSHYGPIVDETRYFTNHPDPDRWSKEPGEAAALFKRSSYTSVSVAWLEGPRRWILIYSKANNNLLGRDYEPTGPVVARLGENLWSWSDEIDLFDPGRDEAYGSYMHWPAFENIHREVAPSMSNEAGWSYGAFLLNRFTKWHAQTRTLDLYYLLSLHRPYQVQVMFTKLRLP